MSTSLLKVLQAEAAKDGRQYVLTSERLEEERKSMLNHPLPELEQPSKLWLWVKSSLKFLFKFPGNPLPPHP
jgi:hypothetical protein